MKRCKQCKKEQPTSCFYKNKSKKDGLNYNCKLCAREQKKKHYEDNREKILEQQKKHYEDNREKILEQIKKYREDNREKILECKKKYRENNKEKIIEKNKKYREDNREKILEQSKKYYENNKEKVLEQSKKYRENNKEKILEYRKKHYENMPAGIYVIKNTVNDKIYIGCSTMLPRRWKDHKSTLKKGTHDNQYLQKDFEKYGLGAFEFNVIKEYPKDTPFEVLEREETRIILENAKKKTSIYNISIKIRSYIS